MVSRLKHENLIQLLGFCVDGNLRILAYEFATMGSLHDILHGKINFLDFEILCSILLLHKLPGLTKSIWDEQNLSM